MFRSFQSRVLPIVLVSVCAAGASADMFQITIENLGPNVLTPAPFISHNAAFDLFSAGAPASASVEALAEDGMVAGVLADAAAAGANVADVQVAGAAPIPPGGSAMIMLNADAAHPWLSFASMLAVSNDAFIGVATGDGAIDLYPGGSPFNGVIMLTHREVWDAGTEVNDELAINVPALGGAGSVDENGVIFAPHAGILGVGDIPLSFNWVEGDVARITIVPEPATLSLLGLGLFALLRRRG